LITILEDGAEVHPAASVTVTVYVPVAIPDTVVVVPVPEADIPAGVLVTVHVPVAGRPFNTTLPVARAQVGWVIVPGVGAVGAPGAVFITILADGAEVHPAASVTVTVYVPAAMPDTVVVVPVPEAVIPAGVLVTVHVPVAGRPFNTTDPVARAQVGWVIVPGVGGAGVAFTVRVAAFDVALLAEQLVI